MEKIINISWENEKFNIRKLARWIRCLFQMTLNIDPTMSLKCLDNALAIVTRMRSAQVGVSSFPSPPSPHLPH